MGRVFLAEQNARYDVEPAKVYGDIVYLTDSVNPYNTQTCALQLVEELEREGFNPKKDFVCMTGQTITLAVLLAILVQAFGTVRMLIFDARHGTYRERVTTFPLIGVMHEPS